MNILIESVEYDVKEESNINFESKELKININSNTAFFRFLLDYRFKKSALIDYIYCFDSNVSLYNCYFCINNSVVTLKFDSAVTGLNCNSIDYEKTNTVFAEIDYKDYHMGDFEELIRTFNAFNINKYSYSLSINFIPRFCTFRIDYSGLVNVSTITKEFYNFFEFICFICGHSFTLNKLYYMVNGIKICRILNLNSKFDTKKKNLYYNEIIISRPHFKDAYLKWKTLRKETHLIFDLYNNAIHSFHFSEVSLSLLINCMEGYIKSVHIRDFLAISKSMNLDIIMEKMYFSTTYSKKIFKLSERRKYDIFNTLNTHRNYFDHLDRVQPTFTGKKCDYILLKCDLIFRVYILQDLGIFINHNALQKNINNINKKLL